MASDALTAFYAALDERDLGPTATAVLKAVGKRLYAAAARETILHLRHHANAVIDDPQSTNQQRIRAQNILTLTDAVLARDALDTWWLEVVGIS